MLYDNWGQDGVTGRGMCRGTPGVPESLPGGTATQTFTVPSGAKALTSALVQIDHAPVTVTVTVQVNGSAMGSAAATATGDTTFQFGRIPVSDGDQVTLVLGFVGAADTVDTVYTVGSPGGTFTATNTCTKEDYSITVSPAGLSLPFNP